MIHVGDIVEYRANGGVGRNGGCRHVRVVDFDSERFCGEVLWDSRNPMNVGTQVTDRIVRITRVNPSDRRMHFSDLAYKPFTLRSPYDTD